jgi:hypothetical protein
MEFQNTLTDRLYSATDGFDRSAATGRSAETAEVGRPTCGKQSKDEATSSSRLALASEAPLPLWESPTWRTQIFFSKHQMLFSQKLENKIGGLRYQGHEGCAYVKLTSRRYSAVDIVERSAVEGRSGSSAKHVSSSPSESPSS